MNHVIKLLMLILLLISCNVDKQRSNIQHTSIVERIIEGGEYGFIDNEGDTIINFGKYDFLNPLDEKGMILAKLNGKYGYININEDVIVPFVYDDISVFVLGLASAKKNGKYGFINQNGEEAIDFIYDNKSHFNKCGLAKAQLNNKYGYIDTKGNLVLPIEYDKVRGNKIDAIICGMKNNKWAFFSCEGKQLTEFEFDKITESHYDNRNRTFFKSGPCKVTKDGKPTYINSHLKEVIEMGKFETAQLFRNHLAIVSNDGQYGVVDTLGNEVIPLNFEYIDHPKKWSKESDLFVLSKDYKYQFLDSDAHPITEFDIVDYTWDVFDVNGEFQQGFILVREDDKYGVVTELGHLISAFNYDMIEPFDGKSSTPAALNMKYGLINLDGKTILPFRYDKLESIRSTDLLCAEKESKVGIINTSGAALIPFEYTSIDPVYYDYKDRFIVEKNGLFGIVNIDNEIVIPLEYDEISNWVEYGPEEHYVKKNGKHGLMKRDGGIVVPTLYDRVYSDNSELILVEKDGLFGTVNYDHKKIQAIEYEAIYWELPILKSNSLDTIYIRKNGNYFVTDSKGNVIEKDIDNTIVQKKIGYLMHDE